MSHGRMLSILASAAMLMFFVSFVCFSTPCAAKSAESVDERIQSLIKDNKVMVFSKSYCGYSRRAKDLLRSKNAGAFVVELDQDPQGAQIQAGLATLTGQRTVPNIFINGKHIGGSSDLADLDANGELEKLL